LVPQGKQPLFEKSGAKTFFNLAPGALHATGPDAKKPIFCFLPRMTSIVPQTSHNFISKSMGRCGFPHRPPVIF